MVATDTIRRVVRRAKGLHKRLLERADQRVYVGYDAFVTTGRRKRALLSHLTEPLWASKRGELPQFFSPRGMTLSICRALNELGYVVDVVNWDDTAFVPTASYDLFIAHGAVNFESIVNHLPDDTDIIYFSTGSYWKYHNDQELSRFAAFEKRNHLKLPPDRLITTPEEEANRRARGIICLGNEIGRQSYRDFANVECLPIATYKVDYFEKHPKNYVEQANHLLFLSGNGNIHKGLDLLLEAVRGTELVVHIITRIDPEFGAFYSKDLHESGNVVLHGYIPAGSPEFHAIIDQCVFTVLPTCSEGSPGSVADSMMYGLIPIVTREAHIDVDDCGVIIPEASVESVRKTLLSAVSQPAKTLRELAQASYQTALTRHSDEQFIANFKNSLKTVLHRRAGKQ